jgi:hypothetical protein
MWRPLGLCLSIKKLLRAAGKSPGSRLNDRQNAGTASPYETFPTQEERLPLALAMTVMGGEKKGTGGGQPVPQAETDTTNVRKASAIAEARAQEHA